MMKTFHLLLVACCLLMPGAASAQNLLANPGFEDSNVCTELNAHCAPEAWKEVNYSGLSYIQNSKGGKVGIVLSEAYVSRKFLFTTLLCPLVAGEEYEISFDLNLRGAEFRPFGIYFSADDKSGYFSPVGIHPAITFTEKNCVKKFKKMDWMPFSGIFRATGDEQFFYLGYFDEAAPEAMRLNAGAIFFFDNFRLTPKNKNISLCAEAESKRAELYADDWRHGPPGRHADTEPDTLPTDDLPVEMDTTPPPIADTLEYREPQRSDTLILSGICFDFDKSTLNAHYAGITDSITDAIILKNPGGILISGHTDNIGSEEFNLKLSLARARTIEQILIAKGYKVGNIRCVGLGESRPVADNETEPGRQANRRIEIILFFQ